MLSKTKPQSGLRRTLIGYALVLVVGIAALIAVQGFVVKPFLVPSSSMAATILPGQRILVDRMVYHFRAVHRGDIIVFRGPAPPHELLIKRAVGLPGDLLSLHGGRLFVNGLRTSDAHVDRVDGTAEPTEPANPYTSSQTFSALVACSPVPRAARPLLRDGR